MTQGTSQPLPTSGTDDGAEPLSNSAPDSAPPTRIRFQDQKPVWKSSINLKSRSQSFKKGVVNLISPKSGSGHQVVDEGLQDVKRESKMSKMRQSRFVGAFQKSESSAWACSGRVPLQCHPSLRINTFSCLLRR